MVDFRPLCSTKPGRFLLTGSANALLLPQIATTNDDRRSAWFSAYVTTLLARDVRELARIDTLTDLPRLVSLVKTPRVGGLLESFVVMEIDVPLPQPRRRRGRSRTRTAVRHHRRACRGALAMGLPGLATAGTFEHQTAPMR